MRRIQARGSQVISRKASFVSQEPFQGFLAQVARRRREARATERSQHREDLSRAYVEVSARVGVAARPIEVHHRIANRAGELFAFVLGCHSRVFLSSPEAVERIQNATRRAQYRWADDPAKRDAIIKSVVAGKVLNQRSVVARALRDHGEGMAEVARSALTAASDRLAAIVRRLEKPSDADALRGFEGEASLVYFSVFAHLILGDKPLFAFGGRSRRPPLDAANALLSFIYSLLTADVRGAIEGVGLDPAVGFLHVDRPGRPSLVLDMVEEPRPFIADRLVLSLINRRQLGARDFCRLENAPLLQNVPCRSIPAILPNLTKVPDPDGRAFPRRDRSSAASRSRSRSSLFPELLLPCPARTVRCS
jgi:CRISPR-associated endonuclease Cas1